METKTAFDLNTAIERWHDHLRQSPHFRPENLAELESHLRDSVASFRGSPLSEEEAFLVATRRLGGVPALEPEFAKVNGKEVWMIRLLWMLLGAQLWPLVRSCASAVADASVIGGLLGFGYQFKSFTYPNGYPGSIEVVLFAAANVLAVAGCLAVCWWALHKKGRTFANTAASLLRRPLVVPILFWVILLGVLSCIGTGKQVLFLNWLPQPPNAEIYSSMVWGSGLSGLAVGIAFAVMTVLLARRQLRPRTNS
jgi:hypothetical protein